VTPSDAETFIRACATVTWLVISVFLLALAIQGRRNGDD
jgi:hypothetical protein